VWCGRATRIKWIVSSAAIRIGKIRTWAMKRREANASEPGNCPSQIRLDKSAPKIGMERATPFPIARPIPESRSSSSE
jgi:hypothetical protein